MILLVVLVVVAMLSLAALTFAKLMMAEHQAAEMSVRQAQARAAAESGIETARMFLAQDAQTALEAGGSYDNAAYFRQILVADGLPSGGRSRFTIISPVVVEGGSSAIRFGLEDESTKLNLNALLAADKADPTANAARQILMGLPGMDEYIADAILDWLDDDDEPREYGAEYETYASLPTPYAPRNGPIDTIEELLLVRGVTPELLFGLDTNHNGVVDAAEAANGSLNGVDNSDGSMNRGWAAYLTLFSLEANVQPDGSPRINVAQSDLKTLYDQLSQAVDPQWATYIVAYRQNGPYKQTDTKSSKPQNSVTSGEIDFDKPADSKGNLTTILDLIGSPVQVTFKGQKEPAVLQTPFPNDPIQMGLYLPKMMDTLTVNTAKVIPARININQAPKAVISGIPGMTPEIVEQILANRQPDPSKQDDNQRHETWLLTQGIVTLDQMKPMMPFVTGGGSVYRVQSVGYSDEGGPYARIEAVLDASAGGKPARVIFWRDVSHLGRGYSLETLGLGVPGE
jgi:DNA uptake protein ComE-like DNA-binding protein